MVVGMVVVLVVIGCGVCGDGCGIVGWVLVVVGLDLCCGFGVVVVFDGVGSCWSCYLCGCVVCFGFLFV